MAVLVLSGWFYGQFLAFLVNFGPFFYPNIMNYEQNVFWSLYWFSPRHLFRKKNAIFSYFEGFEDFFDPLYILEVVLNTIKYIFLLSIILVFKVIFHKLTNNLNSGLKLEFLAILRKIDFFIYYNWNSFPEKSLTISH